jgi:hypothetical protein
MIRYAEISAIGDFTAFELGPSSLDYLAIDPTACSGGGDADTRVDDDEDAPGSDGSLIFPRLDGSQIITLVGDIVVHSVETTGSTYFAAIEAVYESLRAALNAMKAAPDDLVHPGGSLPVWKHGRLDDSWPSFHICRVTFSVKVDAFA